MGTFEREAYRQARPPRSNPDMLGALHDFMEEWTSRSDRPLVSG